MKKILITAYHGWVFRSVLGGDVLQRIVGMGDVKVIVVVPPDKEAFTKSLVGDVVSVETFDAQPIYSSRYNRFWYRLAFLIENSTYVRDQRLERYEQYRTISAKLNYLLVNALASILSQIRIVIKAFRFLDYYFSPRSTVRALIERHQPDLVFASDIFGEADILFLRNAKARGIRTLGMVRSWDNTTTKGILRLVPDALVVNSPFTKGELIQMHRVPSELIAVVGLPQFDRWVSGPTLSREEFFKRIGADISKRLLLFAPAGKVMSDTDWELCQILKDAISTGKLPDDLVILVRNHPQHPADLSRFEPDEHFIIEKPGTRTISSDYKGATLNPAENDHLRDSVYYSEIVMYIATSIGLDATVYDKPQIIVSLDGWEDRPYVRSVHRYNQEDCLANMVASGGTSVVMNMDAWIHEIMEYLTDPTRRMAGRVRARDEHMYLVDGKSGGRLAEVICVTLDDSLRNENSSK